MIRHELQFLSSLKEIAGTQKSNMKIISFLFLIIWSNYYSPPFAFGDVNDFGQDFQARWELEKEVFSVNGITINANEKILEDLSNCSEVSLNKPVDLNWSYRCGKEENHLLALENSNSCDGKYCLVKYRTWEKIPKEEFNNHVKRITDLFGPPNAIYQRPTRPYDRESMFPDRLKYDISYEWDNRIRDWWDDNSAKEGKYLILKSYPLDEDTVEAQWTIYRGDYPIEKNVRLDAWEIFSEGALDSFRYAVMLFFLYFVAMYVWDFYYRKFLELEDNPNKWWNKIVLPIIKIFIGSLILAFVLKLIGLEDEPTPTNFIGTAENYVGILRMFIPIFLFALWGWFRAFTRHSNTRY